MELFGIRFHIFPSIVLMLKSSNPFETKLITIRFYVKVRTLQLNEVIARILTIDMGFGGPKKRKHTDFGMLSLGVVTEGIEPPTQGFSVLCSTD